ncbi:MbtH family protein [Streptomyces solincola]|uniref:MbtH family protein n=1 Tax=Streptomyces solincola TaxID=2100817 RepID=A0A2S9Q1T5_9ACTN|nr:MULTISPECIES: MbtH family NRPS accessory protein [Streptomyces]PRH80608.1 MbtH family protein [Streptomyces solincola]
MTEETRALAAPPRLCVVLRDSLGRHSLWPAAMDAPVGWPVVHGPDGADRCLAFIETAAAAAGRVADRAAVHRPGPGPDDLAPAA